MGTVLNDYIINESIIRTVVKTATYRKAFFDDFLFSSFVNNQANINAAKHEPYPNGYLYFNGSAKSE